VFLTSLLRLLVTVLLVEQAQPSPFNVSGADRNLASDKIGLSGSFAGSGLKYARWSQFPIQLHGA
jgi:hypothetical protein